MNPPNRQPLGIGDRREPRPRLHRHKSLCVAVMDCDLMAQSHRPPKVSNTMGNGSPRSFSRNPGFAHPVLMIRNCSLVLGTYSWCRIRTIMSNPTPPTCGAPASEQCGLVGFPDDHEQSARDGRRSRDP